MFDSETDSDTSDSDTWVWQGDENSGHSGVYLIHLFIEVEGL